MRRYRRVCWSMRRDDTFGVDRRHFPSVSLSRLQRIQRITQYPLIPGAAAGVGCHYTGIVCSVHEGVQLRASR